MIPRVEERSLGQAGVQFRLNVIGVGVLIFSKYLLIRLEAEQVQLLPVDCFLLCEQLVQHLVLYLLPECLDYFFDQAVDPLELILHELLAVLYLVDLVGQLDLDLLPLNRDLLLLELHLFRDLLHLNFYPL